MPPDVLLRKLTYLRQLLDDLQAFENASLDDVHAHHYTVERLFELLVMTTCDILFHELAEHGITPNSYRDAFKQANAHGLLPPDLSAKLEKAAGMRNIIVHLYQAIDYAILHSSIRPALRDFRKVLVLFETRLHSE
ncbi:MAG: DUF86 domain-containing protein [Anaerolineae bacterium]|nr:DUF86 domain-containing protein [Anaerolineae bacterium]